jgi:hypothetical protein
MRFGVFFFLVFAMVLGLRGEAFGYTYGPACQWINLVGKVQVPEGGAVVRPIELTVTYQLPDMKYPATLLTNFPLAKDGFKFFLAGFDQEIAGALFVRPMFFFAKEILFRYHARSADGKWRSEFSQSKYLPAWIPTVDVPKHRDKIYRCSTKIVLEPLVLMKKKPRGYRGL